MRTSLHYYSVLLGRVFFDPAGTFEHLRRRTSLVLPVITLIVLSILFGELISPYKRHIIVSSLSEQMGEIRAKETVSLPGVLSFIIILLTPIPIFLRISIVSVLMLCGDLLIRKERTPYSSYFSVAVFAEPILVLKDYITLLFLYGKGIEHIQTIWDLHFPMGLEILLPLWPEHIILYTIASNINIFALWYVYVLSVGLTSISTLHRWKSFAIISIIWTLGIAFQVMTAILSTDIMKMSGK